SLKTSRTALARSSLLARMSTACSPDQAMDAPTPRKSNRVPISLAAWLISLSTSWRSSLDTISKEDSWDATAPRLDAAGQAVTPNAPRRGSGTLKYGRRTVWSRLGLSFSEPPALRHTAGCPSGQRERSVKPSAQPTLVRTQHLPPPAKTARWLRKRDPGGRFLLVTPCIRVRHYGSMHGSVHVHMVYSVRAKLAVRITAPFAQLAAVGGGRDAVSMQKPGELGAVYAPSGTKASGYPWDLPHAVPVKAASAVMPERAGARTLPAA